MGNLQKQTISGVIWSFIERFSVQGVLLLTTVFMARILSPEDYGLIGMLGIFMALSQVFIDGGFSSALIQLKNKKEEDFSTVFYINISVSIILYVLLFITSPYISDFYNQPMLTAITRVYSLCLIINSLSSTSRTMLTIRIDFKKQSKISLISALFSGIIGITFAFDGYGVWALVAQTISQSISNTLLCFYIVKWHPSFVFSVSSFKKLFSFGSKLLLSSIINSVYNNLYSLVIGKKFTSSDLGYYSRANHFAQFTGSNISDILNRVCFPILSRIQDDDSKLITVYRKYIKMTGFLMFPLVTLLCVSSKHLILLLLGEKWINSIPLLQILSVGYLFNGIVVINLNLLYVKGRSDLVLKLEIIKKTIAIIILIISTLFSLKIVCIGFVVYTLIAFYLNTIYSKRFLNYGFINQIHDLCPYIVISFIVGVEGFIVSELISIHFISLVVSALICICSYLLISHVANLYAYNELREIVCFYIKKTILRH